MDKIGNGNGVANRNQEAIDRGCLFTMSDYFTFGADETKRFLLDPTVCTCRKVSIKELIFSATVGPMKIEFFANTQAADNGTAYSLFNRNIKSANIAKTVLRLNPTVTANGIRIAGRCVTATGANPITGIPAIDPEKKELKLNKSMKYMLAVHNTNGAGAIMQLDFSICEEN